MSLTMKKFFSRPFNFERSLIEIQGPIIDWHFDVDYRISRCVVHQHAMKQTRLSMRALTTSHPISSASPNQMRKENVDVVGDKPVKNDDWEMSMSKEAKPNVWAEH